MSSETSLNHPEKPGTSCSDNPRLNDLRRVITSFCLFALMAVAMPKAGLTSFSQWVMCGLMPRTNTPPVNLSPVFWQTTFHCRLGGIHAHTGTGCVFFLTECMYEWADGRVGIHMDASSQEESAICLRSCTQICRLMGKIMVFSLSLFQVFSFSLRWFRQKFLYPLINDVPSITLLLLSSSWLLLELYTTELLLILESWGSFHQQYFGTHFCELLMFLLPINVSSWIVWL